VNTAFANPILVTRPDEAGRMLAAALNAGGARALWVPAFDLSGAPDPESARATLARLSRFDLAVFVSPSAVRATRQLTSGPWPSNTVIGAVGAATAAAARAHLHPGRDVTLIAPPGDVEGGSEALLRALDARHASFRSVLILRASGGREWLTEQLETRGVEVESLAVYDRRAHALTTQEHSDLVALLAGPQIAIDSVFSSSEAVDAVRAAMSAHVKVWQAMQRGVAITSHPRIAQRLAAAGFARVAIAPLRAGEIITAIARATRQ